MYSTVGLGNISIHESTIKGKCRMTTEEKYIFDLQGYLVIKNVLSDEELTKLNRIADEKFPYGKEEAHREWSMLHWGKPVKRLIDHPKIVPYLVELMGECFRLDHDYCIFMNENETRGGLHGGGGGGGGGWNGTHFYHCHNGVMRNGLSVLTYFLTDAPQGAGGFVCVPGSHKSNFPNQDIPGEVRGLKRPVHYVMQPEAKAGDALFFTEALVHGTSAWTAKTERRTLLFKYIPGHSAWFEQSQYYDFDKIGELTERQKRVLAPASIHEHLPVVE